MAHGSMIEVALRRDRLLVGSGLALVAAVAWAWTLTGAFMPMESGGMSMTEMIGSAAMTVAAWSPSHAALIFLMWWVMMAAMMLPSATPLVLLATSLHRRTGRGGQPAALTAGYLAAWGGFSIGATLSQWGFELTGLLAQGPMMAGAALGGSLMLAAGLYQFTPLKRACLTRCRSPIGFITTHWRPGLAGAFRMGLLHGAFCVGCCWFLMGLLFAGGVMNPFWIGGIALYVLVEKLAPGGQGLSRASGLLLVIVGVWTLSRTI